MLCQGEGPYYPRTPWSLGLHVDDIFSLFCSTLSQPSEETSLHSTHAEM